MLTSSIIEHLTPYLTAKRWIIAFSGGMDSTVLLHALASLRQHHTLPLLQAVYIHHGLQKIADHWPEHCQHICGDLNIPLQIIPVQITKQASIEQAARDARYAAFTKLLNADDVLLTAQHQRDQAETVLFRLFRGAGVRGLSGMPTTRPLGLGQIVRPLLHNSYTTLQNYAQHHELDWIEDPSNQNIHFARNYLRHQIIPTIQSHWPQGISSIARAADHLQEAQNLLDELALMDLNKAACTNLYPWLTIPSLTLDGLTPLSWQRLKNALTYWLSTYTLLPSTIHWKGLNDLINAKHDTMPIWQLHHSQLCRSSGRVWLLKEDWLTAPILTTPLALNNQTLPLPNNGLIKFTGAIPPTNWVIRYRKGGEILHLNTRGHRELKRLFNEEKVPHFIRQRLPLLFDEHNCLLAVANFPQWQDQRYQGQFSFTWQLSI